MPTYNDHGGKPHKPHITVTGDEVYSDEEREFLVAMDRYKRENHRPFPDCRDVLRVAKALGYRKLA